MIGFTLNGCKMENQIEELESIISKIQLDKGSYFYDETVNLEKLKMSFIDIGEINFPLEEDAVKKMLKYGHAAPFGWRDQTVTDRTVRDCFEVDPTFFQLTNEWEKLLEKIVNKSKDGLGLVNADLKADLYKMLIYQKDQHFMPHQDSEKFDGMVATLIAVLPSRHCGGDITIHHHDEKKIIKTDKLPLDKIQFIAFYADCHHEVAPITSGHRVVLTYNLILNRENSKIQFELPEEENKIKNYLTDYFNTSEQFKLVYLLDYEYTQKSLDANLLKENDFLRVQLFKNICQRNNYRAYLTLADIHECWMCEEDYEYDRYSYRKSRSKKNEEEYDLVELVSSDIELKYFKNILDEDKMNFAEIESMDVSESELFMTKAIDKFKPFNSEFEGWMGNYGNTLDRWYHRAGILIWPIKYDFYFLFNYQPKQFLKIINNELLNSTDSEISNKWIFTLSEIFEKQKMHKIERIFGPELKAFFNILLILKDPVLTSKYLKIFTADLFTEDEFELLCDLSEQLGEFWTMKNLEPWLIENYDKISFSQFNFIIQYVKLIKNSDLFLDIFSRAWSVKNNDFFKSINLDINSGITSKEENAEKNLYQNIVHIFEAHYFLQDEKSHLSLKKMLEEFFGEDSRYKGLVQYEILQRLALSDLIVIYYNIDFLKFQKKIKERLSFEVIKNQRGPNDWSMKIDLKCICPDCKILQNFIYSKDSFELKLPLNKDRRQHLHYAIDKNELDISHETIRKGSPFVLNLLKLKSIFTKNDKIVAKMKNLIREL
jgi:hypothetical protein